MKFEDFLMEPPNEENQKRLQLEEEVVKLREELDGEEKLHDVLQFALKKPVLSHPHLSSFLPLQVQLLVAELAMVEGEIIWLERKVEKLKMSLYEERKRTKELKIRHRQRRQHHLASKAGNLKELKDEQYSRSKDHEAFRVYKMKRERKASLGSASDIHSKTHSTRSTGKPLKHTESAERPSTSNEKSRKQIYLDKEVTDTTPNQLSEELIKCLISIFLKVNQASMDSEGSVMVPKLNLSCMNSKNFIPKTSFNCTAPTFSFNESSSNLDPYSILQDLDSTVRDIRPYKNFIQITRNSVDTSRVTGCSAMAKLRVLMQSLCNVELTFLTYKQKLAFWINIYNASIMHAFLQHGLPSTQEKLLALMNKAALNVGGIVLNALAIEHFILRHPRDSIHGPPDEKEMLLRHAYGLGFPEPNVTFALCRGSWSSPALRVYTPDEVVNQLGRAKVEYLEASVGVTSKKKILVPKLLQWHMRDFADDMASLLEWIYSELPRSGSLKRLMMECLNGEFKPPITKMVEIQPYKFEFRYLLPLEEK